jgi:hypothetical protein
MLIKQTREGNVPWMKEIFNKFIPHGFKITPNDKYLFVVLLDDFRVLKIEALTGFLVSTH